MKQLTNTHHTLEMRHKRGGYWTTFSKPHQGMYRPAELLAYQGRLIEAIELAQEICIENYGHMRDTQFRCVTKATTVTISCGPTDSKVLDL